MGVFARNMGVFKVDVSKGVSDVSLAVSLI